MMYLWKIERWRRSWLPWVWFRTAWEYGGAPTYDQAMDFVTDTIGHVSPDPDVEFRVRVWSNSSELRTPPWTHSQGRWDYSRPARYPDLSGDPDLPLGPQPA